MGKHSSGQLQLATNTYSLNSWPGDPPVSIQRGDLVFCRGKGVVDWAIRAAEWLRFRGGAKYNHVAVIAGRMPNGDWSVIEAESPGIITASLSSLRLHGDVEIIPMPHPASPDRAVRFMTYQGGDKYGFLTIASLVVSIILPGSITLYKPGTWICSAVVAEAMRYAGWYHTWDNVYGVTPAQLWLAVTGTEMPHS